MENVDILLVEDNMDDAGLTIRALKEHHLVNNIFITFKMEKKRLHLVTG